MIKCLITRELYEHCRQLATKYNIGHRGFGNGSPQKQMIGMIGESYVRELFGFEWFSEDDCKRVSDPGYDFDFHGFKPDVKTISMTYDYLPLDYYTHNVMAVQSAFKPDAYIFCAFNDKTRILVICGYATREQFERRRVFFPKGTEKTRADGTKMILDRDTYQISNGQLQKVYSYEQLIHEFEMLADQNGNDI